MTVFKGMFPLFLIVLLLGCRSDADTGPDLITLTRDSISITVDPARGGRLVSLTYGGREMLPTTRDSSGFTVSGSTASNTDVLTFGKATAGTETITHVGLGTDETGAGSLLISNALANPLSITGGVTPLFEAGALQFTCD